MNFKKIKLGVVLLGLVLGLGAGMSANAAELITNGGFESKLTGWNISGSPCTPFNGFHHSGTRYAVMGQLENLSDVLSQTVTIPNDIDSATLSYWYNITSEETAVNSKFDKLKVTIQDSGNNILETVDNKSNLDKDNCAVASCYHKKIFKMTKYKGQTVKIHFWATTDDSKQTTFRIDDVKLICESEPEILDLQILEIRCDYAAPVGPAVKLDWDDVSGIAKYNIYRNGRFYVNTSLDSYFDNTANLVAGNTYTYYIEAVDSSRNVMVRSNTVEADISSNICNTTPAPQFGNNALSNEAPICDYNIYDAPAIRLNWNPASGATSYHVYRNGDYYIGTATDTTFYNSANVTAGQTYTYYIQARNASGNTNSNSVTVHVESNICDISPQPSCYDSIQNQNETGVDCGGVCPPCETGDIIPPVISSISPKDNVVGVPITLDRVKIVFSEPMDRSTYFDHIFVTDFQGNRIGGAVYSGESEYHVVISNQILQPNSVYSVYVTTDVTDVNGNHLVEEFVSSFTTGEALTGDQPPTISGIKFNGSSSSELSAGTTQVTISFQTDKVADCRYSILPNTSYDSMGLFNSFSTFDGVSHFKQFVNLSDGTCNNYYVKCKDDAESISDDYLISFSVGVENQPQCSDGIDNDGDGYTDYPNDFWCDSPEDNNEQGPTLEFIETVGDFSDGVNPNSGNPESQFTFKVNYTHPDNVEYPVQVNIFDELYDMVPDLSANGNYADGEQYTISMPANWGSDLSVPFYFEAFSEEGIVIRLPEDENEFLYFEVNDDQLPIFPRVTTKTVTDITDTSVKLHGSINPNGLSAKVFFTWGETETSQNPTMTFPEVSMETSVAKFSKTISRLNPNTTYIYRAVGTNVNGTVFGDYLEFTTFEEDGSDEKPDSFSIISADTYCDTQKPVGPAVRLEWELSVGAESYEIYRNGAKYITLLSSETIFENNMGIEVGVGYEYYVKAINSVGETESVNRMTVEILEGVCGLPEQNYEDLIREFEVSRLEVYVADELYYIVSMSCAINIENMTCENSDTPYTIYLDKNNHIVSDSSIVRKIGIIEIARDIDMDKISSKYAALQKIETIQKDLVKKEEMFNSAMDLAKKAVLIEDAIEKSNKVFELSYEIVSMQIEYQETLVILEVGSEDSILILQDVRSSIMLQKTKYINRVRNLDKIAMAKNLFLNLAPTGIVFFQKALIGDPMEAVKTDMDNEYNAAINNYKSALMKYYGQCANIKDYKSASSLISSQKNGITHEKNYLMLHEMIVKNFDKAFMSFYLSFTRDIALGALTGGWSELKTMVGPSLDAMKALDWTLTIRYDTALSNGYDGCYLAHHFSGGAINTLRISQEKLSVDTNGLREKIDECNQNIRDNALEIYNQPIKYLEEHWFVKVSIEMDKYLPMIPIELVEPLIDSPVDWITEMLEKADKYYVPTPVGWGAGMFIDSPVELRIIDEYERITGIVDGEVFLEVPYSIYFEENEGFIILNLDNDSEIKFEIKAIDNGVYGIHIYSHSTDTNNSNSIHGKDIPIVLNEIHQYTINWQALASGEQGVTIQIDQDGDGTFEKTITSDATLEASEITGDDSSSENNNIGGGGSVSATLPVDTSIIINNEESDTVSKDVVLTLSASGAMQMAISNSSDFAGVSWEDYETSKEWTLTSDAGEKTVYAKFRSSNGGVSAIVSDDIILNSTGMVKGVTTTEIIDGDIIQCQTSENPFAVYVVKIVGDTKYIRHLVSLEIFNHYRHLKWENLKQVESLNNYSLSGWIRYNTGSNRTAGPNDKVYEINGDQTKHWINMTAEQFLTHGGSDAAIYNINQGELDLYITGADVVISN